MEHPSDPPDKGPSTASPPSPHLRIGGCTVEPERFLVACGERRWKLEPKVMTVLLALAEEAGQVVSRARLLDRVWGDKFVTEEVLTRAISQLRRGFSDDSRRPRYIETIRQGGYRLIATVEPLPRQPAANAVLGALRRPRVAQASASYLSMPERAGGRSGRAALSLGIAGVLAISMLLVGADGGDGEGAPRDLAAPSASYLEGRYFLNRRNRTGYHQAIQRFHAALAAHPLDAPTHAALAESYLLVGFYRSGVQSVPDAMERARAAARRALELDPGQPQAQAVLGAIAWTFDYDFATAERHLRAASTHRPGFATAHQWLSWVLLIQGRDEAAAAELATAAHLDPLSGIIATAGGTQAWIRGDYFDAERRLRSALEMDPDFARAHFALGLTHEAKGELAVAQRHFEHASAAMGPTAESRAASAHCLARSGQGERAGETLAELVAAAQDTAYSAAFEIALLYEVLGHRAEALAWLAEGLRQRTILSYGLFLDPRLAALRRDPRFPALISRVPYIAGIPPSPSSMSRTASPPESGAGIGPGLLRPPPAR
ncbi:MAG TPA: winged helix-turn-helix domain-containing protein [Thermoanaerobaculia bacterium]|nr:winged helix-turn-helix domain-containing protein [Thermoanaerobaculia bacterium]